jgi:hypothetical protein
MNSEQLAQVHQARPFRPFRLKMADGSVYEVSHPEFLARSGRTLLVAFPNSDGFAVLDLMLVSSIEVGDRPRGRGRRKAG